MKRSFSSLVLFVFMLIFTARPVMSQPVDDASAGENLQTEENISDFQIPGGPPVKMLQDFNKMFPDEDFYEEPSKEIKDQFIQKFPLWGFVVRRMEKDDQKRMKAEEFFDAHGAYPTAESHGAAPLSDYLLDYLEYEKEGAPPVAETKTADIEAEIRSLFPGWDGKEVTPVMEEKFNRHFADGHFGSWNPLFYGDLLEDNTYSDEDVDEGLIYEEDENAGELPDENWLMQETVEKPEEKSAPTATTETGIKPSLASEPPKSQASKVSRP